MSATTQPDGLPAGRPPRRSPGRSPLAIQLAVIGALVMREMQTRFGRHNLGFLWLFLEPMLLGSAVGLLHAMSGHGMPGGLDPFMFSMVGYVPFFAFRAIVNRSPTAIHSNLTLLFHRQVTLFDIVTARNLLEIMAVTVVITVVLAAAAVGGGHVPEKVGMIVLGMMAMFLLAHGVAMLLAAGGVRSETFDRLVHPVTYLLMPLSGAFFALHWFPPEVREALSWMPLVHVHEIIRTGYFGSLLPGYYDVPYLLAWIAGTNLLGMAALRSVRRRLTMF